MTPNSCSVRPEKFHPYMLCPKHHSCRFHVIQHSSCFFPNSTFSCVWFKIYFTILKGVIHQPKFQSSVSLVLSLDYTICLCAWSTLHCPKCSLVLRMYKFFEIFGQGFLMLYHLCQPRIFGNDGFSFCLSFCLSPFLPCHSFCLSAFSSAPFCLKLLTSLGSLWSLWVENTAGFNRLAPSSYHLTKGNGRW